MATPLDAYRRHQSGSATYAPPRVVGGRRSRGQDAVPWETSLGRERLFAEQITRGTIYFVVYPTAESEPSAAQIRAGQRSSGSAAVAAGSEPARYPSGEQVWSALASGLTASTTYDVSFVWASAVDESAVVTGSFTTDASGGSQSLTLTLFANTNSFGTPTVTRGAVTLTPTLVADGDSFGSHTVTRGAVTLSPTAFTDGDSFGSPTVTRGAVTLSPTRYTNSSTFGAAVVTRGAVTLTATLYSDSDSFGAATITQGATLAPTRYVNTNTFGSPAVGVGAVTLAPTLYADADSFGSPTVGRGTVTLAPTLYADADSFGAATVTQGGLLLPTLYVNENTFGAHVVVRGAAPDTGEQQATPGYSRGDGRSHRYRVRVGKRWIEVDPLDDASLRAVYIAAEQEAQKAAESRVAAPRRSAARVVAAAAPRAAGVDYAAVRAEAQRISEMVRAVYAEALQRELIGRLMREQIERDDEDDIELLLMV